MFSTSVVGVSLHNQVDFGQLHKLVALVLLPQVQQLVQSCQVVRSNHHLRIVSLDVQVAH